MTSINDVCKLFQHVSNAINGISNSMIDTKNHFFIS